jgi:branched-chain amino acid transport system ATP-binding protein
MPADTSSANIVSVSGVTHRYSGVLALENVSLSVPRGAFMAIFGPNGAGKSTLGMILGGMLQPTAGQATRPDPADRIALVPEGRRLFGQLSVRDNLILGAYGARASRAESLRRLDEVMVLMPKSIQDGVERQAVTLSGGERQMLALGRALMARPQAIVLDEPSLGLAPVLIDKVYEVLDDLHRKGTTIVVIEQMATWAAAHAQTMAVIDRGRIVYQGAASGDAADAALRAGYVGEAGAVA